MKFRVALVTVFIAGLAASLAVAAPTKTAKQQTETNTTAATTTTTSTTTGHARQKNCRHRFALVLEGKLVSVASDQLSFAVDVKRSNRHARLHRGQILTVQVDANTKIWRLGKEVTLGELTLGDRLVVQLRNCKKGTDPTTALLAARVVARPVPTEKACHHRSALVLEGTLVSIAPDRLSFTVDVKHSNRHARLHRGQILTVHVDANTKIWRLHKEVTLGDLTLGDRLVVQTRVCKKDFDPTAALVATRVMARPARPAPPTTTTGTITTTAS